MRSRWTHLRREERGMSLVWLGMGFMAFFAASTLAIDVGMFMTARSQAQNAADAGALAGATSLAAQMVGSFGMAGSLISYEAVADGPLSRSNLVGKILANTETKQKVEDILESQRARVTEVLAENRDVHAALVAALLERDELVRDEILEVIEKAIANRP